MELLLGRSSCCGLSMPVASKESTRAHGSRVEYSAEKHLVQNFHRVVDKNVHFRVGELDLVAVDLRTNELVFVEVRSRVASGGRESPLESLGFGKMRRLRLAIECYLARMSRAELQRHAGIRLDLLGWDGHGWNWVKGLE